MGLEPGNRDNRTQNQLRKIQYGIRKSRSNSRRKQERRSKTFQPKRFPKSIRNRRFKTSDRKISNTITFIKLPKEAAQALKIGDHVWVKGKEWEVNKVVRKETGYHIQLERQPTKNDEDEIKKPEEEK